jgi:hypothetical protein
MISLGVSDRSKEQQPRATWVRPHHRRRQSPTQPPANRPTSTKVPGSGTAVGMYVSESLCLAASSGQPNAPLIGLAKPLSWNALDASNVAPSAGPA